MSEWASLLAVYWLLWALDGVRLGPWREFSLVAGSRIRQGSLRFSRLVLPPLLPTGWRVGAPDVPLSFSPAGVCNVPVGSAGRPAEAPAGMEAWRWDEIRHIGVSGKWIYINGRRFCPDTGHAPAARLLQLAELRPEEREVPLDALLRGWFRPARLRRRARVLVGRTAAAAACNAAAIGIMLGLTLYLGADLPARLGEERAARVAAALPYVLGLLLLLHASGVVLAWRALGHVRTGGGDRRRATLFSALLLPPQALKLRALVGEGAFPPQHPVAIAAAFGRPAARRECGFQALADVRWPVVPVPQSDLVREITGWFGARLTNQLNPLLAANGDEPEALLAPPAPDGPASCRYCPRCRDQFVAGPGRCPHGIALLPLRAGGKVALAAGRHADPARRR